MERKISNVIDLASCRFPIGSQAYHPKYGICQVIESIGVNRVIEYACVSQRPVKFVRSSVAMRELKKFKNATEIQKLSNFS